jgi:hypothetical protein
MVLFLSCVKCARKVPIEIIPLLQHSPERETWFFSLFSLFCFLFAFVIMTQAALRHLFEVSHFVVCLVESQRQENLDFLVTVPGVPTAP